MSRVLHVLNNYRPALTPEGEFLERCSAAMQEIAPEIAHDLLVIRTPRPAEAWEAAGCSTIARVAYLTRRPRGAAVQGAALSWWLLRNLRRYDAVHFREGARPGRLDHLIARLFGRRLLLPIPETAGAALPSLPAPWGKAPERPGAAARLRERLGLAADALVLLLPAVPARPEEALFLVDQLPAVAAEAPRARLLLGSPAGAEAFRARARELGVEGHLAVAGEAGGPLPASAADILVLAERVEEPGGALAEGMARGLPVVAPRGTVLVADGETGSLYDTPAGYAAAVVRLAADAALRDRLGKAGRERARHLSGLGGVARRQLEMYRAEMHRAGAPAGPAGGLPAPALRRPEDGETGLGATASVLDERFHRPVPVAPDAPPRVLTMVDAEEAFDWSSPSRAARPTSAPWGSSTGRSASLRATGWCHSTSWTTRSRTRRPGAGRCASSCATAPARSGRRCTPG